MERLSGLLKLGANLVGVNPNPGPTLTWKVNGRRLLEEKPISEGGFAFVVQVRDLATGERFALKKIICQEAEALRTAEREAEVLEALPSHKNIVEYFGHVVLTPGVNGCPHHQVLVLLELCPGGTLLDFLDSFGGLLPEPELLRAITDVAEALFCLHSHRPPIQHRDLKLENVLRGHDGFWKLVDFGSWSDKSFDLTDVPVKDIVKLQEEVTKNTTFMYRPPEMVDLYLRYPVCCAVDIWMLGCILFALLYRKHPFQEAATLAIREAKYWLPERTPPPTPKVVDLLVWLLAPEPRQRPSARKLVNVLWQWQDIEELDLPPAVQEHRARLLASWESRNPFAASSSSPFATGGRSAKPGLRRLGQSPIKTGPSAYPQPNLGAQRSLSGPREAEADKTKAVAVAAAAAAAADAAAAAASPWTADFDFGSPSPSPPSPPAKAAGTQQQRQPLPQEPAQLPKARGVTQGSWESPVPPGPVQSEPEHDQPEPPPEEGSADDVQESETTFAPDQVTQEDNSTGKQEEGHQNEEQCQQPEPYQEQRHQHSEQQNPKEQAEAEPRAGDNNGSSMLATDNQEDKEDQLLAASGSASPEFDPDLEILTAQPAGEEPLPSTSLTSPAGMDLEATEDSSSFVQGGEADAETVIATDLAVPEEPAPSLEIGVVETKTENAAADSVEATAADEDRSSVSQTLVEPVEDKALLVPPSQSSGAIHEEHDRGQETEMPEAQQRPDQEKHEQAEETTKSDPAQELPLEKDTTSAVEDHQAQDPAAPTPALDVEWASADQLREI